MAKIINNVPKHFPDREGCPFCGSPAVVTLKWDEYRVECKERFNTCPVNMRTHGHKTMEEAIEEWNTRA